MSLSRIAVLPYDGFLYATIGSARPDDEAEILAALSSASAAAASQEDVTVKVVVVYGEAEVIETALAPADVKRVQALVMEANRRAHMEPVSGQ